VVGRPIHDPTGENLMTTKDSKEQQPEIDYMHPNGVPSISEAQKKINKEEQKKPVSKQALDEADGHHICTDQCLGKHS
jgi:hypothetical protein